MPGIAAELVIILLLLALNGIFAMSELAVVTARKVRLEQRAEAGDQGARAALDLAQHPTQFLSTVQVGITLIGVLAGAFGGATISEELAAAFELIPAVARYADALALGIVVAGITYLSLLIGELIPKRVALSNPERVASLVARPMRVLARFAAPLVAVLTLPTNLVLRLFGIRMSTEPSVTVEEIRALVEQGAESGVVEYTEHHLVERVFRLGDRQARDVMTPRVDLDWIDINDPPETIRRKLATESRSQHLVCDDAVENILGVVYAEDLLARLLAGEALDLRAALWKPLYILETTPALDVLERFRRSREQVAVVLDEYGGLQGVILLDDLLEDVVGEINAGADGERPEIVQRDDRTWEIRGSIPLVDIEDPLEIRIPPNDRKGVRTLAGFIMTQLGRIPRQGESIEWRGFRFEVAEMEGRRVERVLVRRLDGARAQVSRELGGP